MITFHQIGSGNHDWKVPSMSIHCGMGGRAGALNQSQNRFTSMALAGQAETQSSQPLHFSGSKRTF